MNTRTRKKRQRAHLEPTPRGDEPTQASPAKKKRATRKPK